jgi:hypothetical protein
MDKTGGSLRLNEKATIWGQGLAPILALKHLQGLAPLLGR